MSVKNKNIKGSTEIQELQKIDKQEDRKAQKIRTRQSYSLFSYLYDFLKTEPDIREILWKFYNILDAKRSFGSETHSNYAAESLELLVKDKAQDRQNG